MTIMDFRPVLYLIGLLLCILSLSMSIPMFVDLYTGSPDWKVFALSMVVTAFFGGAFILSNTTRQFKMSLHQGFLFIVFTWVAISLFGALPFRFSELDMTFTDAFFETVSGITTTGATVITSLETTPPGILMWRAILQWLGGIGIVLMAMSVLPFLNVGGMQIFRTELSENEKALPRVTQLASSIGLIYLALTGICAICYMATGFGAFDAVIHAMTTISTGGFSTYDTSFGHYDSAWPEVVAIIFMILGGIPFVLYLKAVHGNVMPFFRDTQVQTFLSVVAVSIVITVSFLTFQSDLPFFEALRRASFNIVSLITGTGFVNGDYGTWGGFVVSLFFFLMVVGACAGSTSCGIKIFRFQVLAAVVGTQLKKLVYPDGVFMARYNHRPISEQVSGAVMGFFFLYALCFSLVVIALSYVGLDFLTAMSGAATTISNVGPGLGDMIGPSGTFAPLPGSAKWIMCAAMLLGRLEIFPLIVILTPHFWRR